MKGKDCRGTLPPNDAPPPHTHPPHPHAHAHTCVFVTLCTVVMQPCTMPRRSSTTLTTGARQLVVQLAAVTMASLAALYSSWFTPYTMLSTGAVASLTGADTTTLVQPRSKKGCRAARVRCSPLHSSITDTPSAAQSTCY